MKKTKIIFIYLLLLFTVSHHISAQKDTVQKETLSFLHITDLHVIFNQSAYFPSMMEYRKQKQYDKAEKSLREFLSTKPKQTKSDMVIATGDLVDFFESNDSDDRLLDIQAKQFSELLKEYHIPVFLTLGNHDTFSFQWQNNANNLLHNQNNTAKAKALWIKNTPCFDGGTYYSKIYKAGETTYRLIFLDDSFYQFTVDDKTEVPYIEKAQLYWLNNQLKEQENDVEIILMHIPFKNDVATAEPINPLYVQLSKYPSCKLILAGHHHKNEITKLPSAENNELIQIQTGSLVQTNDWRLIKLTEKNISISASGKIDNEIIIQVKK